MVADRASTHREEHEELAALHALGTLQGKERADFERHLSHCQVCRTLVEQHRVTLLALLKAVPEREPSPGHKARLMRRAASGLALADGHGLPDTASVAALDRSPRHPIAAHHDARPANERLADSVPTPRRRRGGLTWRGLAALAASLVLAAALVGVAASRLVAPEPTSPTVLSADGPDPDLAARPSPVASPARPRVVQPSPSPLLAAGAPTTASAATSDDPVQTVRRFYALLGQGQYDDLLPLLSPRLRASSPWQPGALRDRTPPGELVVEEAGVVSMAPDRRQATVRVVVRETVPPPLSQTRHYVGTWQLVRGDAGWLLDGSDLQIE